MILVNEMYTTPTEVLYDTNFLTVIGGHANTLSYVKRTKILTVSDLADVLPPFIPAEFNIQLSKSELV